MESIVNLKKEAKELLKLASPLVITQLAQVAIVVINTLMMGLLGTHALAAGGLALVLFAVLRSFGNGMTAAISNLIAYEHGRNVSSEEIGNFAKAGFIITTVLGIVFYIMSFGVKPLLVWSGQDNSIISLTIDYLQVSLIGILPCFWFLVLRNFTIGLRHSGKLMVFTLISLVLNILCNFILMFGYLGFPALGLIGIAWANNIVFLSSFILFAVSIAKNSFYKKYNVFNIIDVCSFTHIVKVFNAGLPIAITYVAETGFFLVIALLMGHISAVALAADAIVIQCVNVTYMITIGISQAASMCIGHAYGANDYYAIRRYAYIALGMGFVFMGTIGIIFWQFGPQIIFLFIRENTPLNTRVYALGVQLLLVAAVFQIFDGWQNIAGGILRGFKAMHMSMYISILGYWVIGLPLAYFLGFHTQQGAVGIWWGLAGGLAITAMLYIFYFEKIYRKHAAETVY
ncbi:NorM family multidrug efflux MATE transporter [soil metagenome]